MLPSMVHCLQKHDSNHAGPKPLVSPTSASPTSALISVGGQELETQSVQAHLGPKVPSQTFTSQESISCTHHQKQERAQSQNPEQVSPHLLFKKSSLPEFYALQKPVGVSSFLTNGHICLFSFSRHGHKPTVTLGGVSSPHSSHKLCSLCHELVPPRFWSIKPQLWFQSQELPAPPPANNILFILVSCLMQVPFFG